MNTEKFKSFVEKLLGIEPRRNQAIFGQHTREIGSNDFFMV